MCGAHHQTYSQEVAFVLLDLIPDVLIEEQLAENEGAHGLHVQTLRLCQDFLISAVDGPALLPLLEIKSQIVRGLMEVSKIKYPNSKYTDIFLQWRINKCEIYIVHPQY